MHNFFKGLLKISTLLFVSLIELQLWVIVLSSVYYLFDNVWRSFFGKALYFDTSKIDFERIVICWLSAILICIVFKTVRENMSKHMTAIFKTFIGEKNEKENDDSDSKQQKN